VSIDDLEWSWNELGKRDPLWAILTSPEHTNRRWDLEEFLATGQEFLVWLDEVLRTFCPDLRRGRALDFGCGVGRLTQPLGDYFQEVVGVDIAASMIEKAKDLNRHGDRCTYLLNVGSDLNLLATNSFDFVITYLVLQHMPPDLACGYLREFLRVLKPGGIMFFQIPVASAGAEPQAIPTRGTEPIMWMFATQVEDAMATVVAGGGEVVQTQKGEDAPGWVSYRVLVRKRA